MILFWCPRKSSGAARIVSLLERSGVPVKRAQTVEERPERGALIVNWGSMSCPKTARTLNAKFLADKERELVMMRDAGVPTPPYSKMWRSGWLARQNDHMDGSDLKENLSRGDYYVQYIPTTAEYRVHSFRGTSILLGHKVHRDDAKWKGTPHEKFRTFQLGWTIEYPAVRNPAIPYDRRLALRALAHKAVAAVGYDFGAVDIGLTTDGKLIVFEVNSAPGLEGCEVPPYVDAILEAHGD